MMNRPADTSIETTDPPSDGKWDNATWSHDNSGNEWSVGPLVDFAKANGQLTKIPIQGLKHNFVPDPTDNPPSPDEHNARVEKANLEYPIVVVQMSDGKLCIADGFHRTEKGMSTGNTHIEAYVIDYAILPPPDIQNPPATATTRKLVGDALDNKNHSL